MRAISSTLALFAILTGCGALRPLGTLVADDTDVVPITSVDPADCTEPLVTTYADGDGDGVGDSATAAETCGLVDGRVDAGGDCDDSDPGILPGGLEICDTRDNDCDALIDDGDDSLDPSSLLEWFGDKDVDGYGAGQPIRACAADGSHPVADGTDCNDANPNVNPGIPEICGAGDQDCDGLVDDADPDVDPATQATYYTDGDGDGYGDPASAAQSCDPGAGQVDNDDDCDDKKKLIGPAVTMWSDADLDGYGDGVSIGKLCPPAAAGNVESGGSVDCDDGNSGRFPGNVEVCGDGVDQDCVGSDRKCVLSGSYLVNSGPYWMNDPQVFSCVEACEVVFGVSVNPWQCSTSGASVNHLAFASTWGKFGTCVNPVADTYSLEDPANPGYDCGSAGCAVSAFVQDLCYNGETNYCYH